MASSIRQSDYRALYRALGENLPDSAIFQIDSAGIIADWNTGVEKLLGYTEQELAGREIVSIIHPDDLAANLPQLQRVVAGGTPGFVNDKRYVRKDGGVVWVRSSVSRLTDEGGNGRLVALVEDITHLKK